VLAIGINLLELRQIKVANFLPSLIVAPMLSGVLNAMGLLH